MKDVLAGGAPRGLAHRVVVACSEVTTACHRRPRAQLPIADGSTREQGQATLAGTETRGYATVCDASGNGGSRDAG
jgi:hypothetical protein